jgi:hypothetical protein
MSPEGRRERYLLATFERSQCAVPLTCIDRMVREPAVQPWVGRASVRGFVMVEGWLVWVVAAVEVFPDLSDAETPQRPNGGSQQAAAAEAQQGSWLMLFRQEGGLSRLGVLADSVKGPLSLDRLSNLRIVRPGPRRPRDRP